MSGDYRDLVGNRCHNITIVVFQTVDFNPNANSLVQSLALRLMVGLHEDPRVKKSPNQVILLATSIILDPRGLH